MNLTARENFAAIALSIDPDTAAIVADVPADVLYDPRVMLAAGTYKQQRDQRAAENQAFDPRSLDLATLPADVAVVLRHLADPEVDPQRVSARTGIQMVTIMRILANPQYRAAINHYRAVAHQVAAEVTGIKLADVVQRVADVAMFDIRVLFDGEGRVLQASEMHPLAAMTISSIEVEEIYEGRGSDRVAYGRIKKIKIPDRLRGLDMLMKHLGGYDLDNRQKVNPLAELLQQLASRNPGGNQLRPVKELPEALTIENGED